MLVRYLLINALMLRFEHNADRTLGDLQKERQRLHAMPLFDLGELYRTELAADPHDLKPTTLTAA